MARKEGREEGKGGREEREGSKGGREGGRMHLSVEGPSGRHPVGNEPLVLAHISQDGGITL